MHTDTQTYTILHEAYIPHIQFRICDSADVPNTFIHTQNTERGNKQTGIEKDIWFVDGRHDGTEKDRGTF